MSTRLMLLLSVSGLSACDKPFKEPMVLGDQTVSASDLNFGRDTYRHYCRPCHGENGDGKGYSSYGLRPPPRDFSQAMFKFGHVEAPSLPPDSELERIVKGGLHGTAMLPWELPPGELKPVLQYIKTFAPNKWNPKHPDHLEMGKPIEVAPDPFGAAKKEEGITLGKKVFHAKAQCAGCHGAFVTHKEMFDITKEMTGTGQTEFAATFYDPGQKETEYCLDHQPVCDGKQVPTLPEDFVSNLVRGGVPVPRAEHCVKWRAAGAEHAAHAEPAKGEVAKAPAHGHLKVDPCESYCEKLKDTECRSKVQIVPPYFTRDAIRTVTPGASAQQQLQELYLTIGSGINGAAMPKWKGALKEEELWALVYYVKSLVDLRGTDDARKLHTALADAANAAWKPEGTPAPAPAPAPEKK